MLVALLLKAACGYVQSDVLPSKPPSRAAPNPTRSNLLVQARHTCTKQLGATPRVDLPSKGLPAVHTDTAPLPPGLPSPPEHFCHTRRLDGTNPLSSAHTYGRAGAAPSPLRLRRSRVPCAVGGGLGGGPAPPRQLQQRAQRRPAAVAAVSTAPPQSPSAGSPPQKWRLDGGPGVHVAGVGGG